ncbi:MAG: hypothetical protein JWP45_3386 [Mucilaginibacter sp.]|nr:hypothetical protein [Mucilaginibacter sp.]
MKKYIILLSLLIISIGLKAQKADSVKKVSAADSLLNSMGSDDKNQKVVIFKSSRLVLSQTTETVKKKNLNFLVIHRFGDFAGKNGGGKLYFGLDDVADVYIGFEYGVTDNLNIDIGRTTIGGLADLEVKYAVLHQMKNDGSPVAITVLGEAAIRPYGFVSYPRFSDRLSHLAQVMIARKFSDGFSLQVTPTYVSNGSSIPLVAGSEQNYFALAAAARLKLTKHMGLIIDYAHPFSSFRTTGNGFYDPLGVGIEIETGGHVFTINITNARAVDEINYLNATQSNFSKGQFRLGFTISRMFDFNRSKN